MSKELMDRLVSDPDELARLLEEYEETCETGFDAADFERKLKARVKGQDHLIRRTTDLLRKRLRQERGGRPLASVFILGLSSTGKSEFMKAVTEARLGDEKRGFTISCGDMDDYAISNLVGLQKGFGTHNTAEGRGELTKHIEMQPDTVIGIDEFDKVAPPGATEMARLTKILYNLLGEGTLQDQRTMQQVDASQSIVIATSNVAEQEAAALADQYGNNSVELEKQLRKLLEQNYPSAFVKRWDIVTTTFRLPPQAKMEIATMRLHKLVKSYKMEVADRGLDQRILIDVLRFLKGDVKTFREFDAWLEPKSTSVYEASEAGAKVIKLVWDAEALDEDGQPGVVKAEIVEMRGGKRAPASAPLASAPAQSYGAPAPEVQSVPAQAAQGRFVDDGDYFAEIERARTNRE